MNASLIKKLKERKQLGNYRSLFVSNLKIDFFSNDYLGFARENLTKQNVKGGATGSRLLSGNSSEAMQCEVNLAQHFNAEASLVFNSGYAANMGVLSAVLQRNDTVLYDQYIHASSRDGIQMSHAKSISFKHNDVADLEHRLDKSTSEINYVVVESLYSMDGDFAPLTKIVEVCERYKADLIVDEAHSGGVFGAQGRGLVWHEKLSNRIFCRILTFGKAYGFHGAVVLGSEHLISYLVNFSRPFIYSTALPIGDYLTITQRCTYNEMELKQEALQRNILLFRKMTTNLKLLSDVMSPIQIVEFSETTNLIDAVDALKVNGIYTKAILPPTVPKGKARLRLCMHAFNTSEEIELLTKVLSAIKQ